MVGHAGESVTAPAGWYPDPSGARGQRYWDGQTWAPKRRLSRGAKVGMAAASVAIIATVVGLVATNESKPSPPRPPSLPADSIAEDGTYKVDDCFGCRPDPGTWQSNGGVGPGYCIWMRKTSDRIGADNVIERGELAPGERGRVRLQQGEYFTTTGCQPWVFIE